MGALLVDGRTGSASGWTIRRHDRQQFIGWGGGAASLDQLGRVVLALTVAAGAGNTHDRRVVNNL
jgi:hypothetical protein